MNLVIVESPAKAKTINKYLGSNYTVLASYGHIRDLPSKNGSVDPENKFKMIWEIDSFSKKYLKEIVDVVKDSEKVILATDPDREGEAIAWHVKEYLDEKKLLKDKKIERVVFNEITKKAVTKGIENPRSIEPQLVDAYMARRALDYLVGFNISPILWTKLPGSKSAGRVQSVALRLLTEREHEIEIFKPEEYWTLNVIFKTKENNLIVSNINQLNGNKIEKFSFRNKEEINSAVENIKNNKYEINDISSKIYSRNPSGPFTTSTIQQTASSKLGFGASRTMQIAQRLYQGIDIEGDTVGLITYMRTDGTNISKDAVNTFRNFITENYGKNYLPEVPLNYSGKKAKNAQEAHEAIRPTEITRKPEDIKKYLSTDQFKLYKLIWTRALSSQMESAKFDRKTITISSVDGKNITFPSIDSLTEAQEELIGLLNHFQPPGSEIVIAYVTPEDFDIFENYEEPTFTEFVQIMAALYGGKDVPYWRFKEDVANNKKDLNEIKKTLNKINTILVEQDKYISSLAEVEMSNVVDAAIPFPAFIDNENAFAATILAVNKKTINGETIKTARIITSMVIYINNRILNVAFYSNLKEGSDIIVQEEKVKNWLKSFWKANLY